MTVCFFPQSAILNRGSRTFGAVHCSAMAATLDQCFPMAPRRLPSVQWSFEPFWGFFTGSSPSLLLLLLLLLSNVSLFGRYEDTIGKTKKSRSCKNKPQKFAYVKSLTFHLKFMLGSVFWVHFFCQFLHLRLQKRNSCHAHLVTWPQSYAPVRPEFYVGTRIATPTKGVEEVHR